MVGRRRGALHGPLERQRARSTARRGQRSRELSAVLGGEALGQRLASSGGGFGKMVGRPGTHLPSSVDPSDPDAVAAWWASLDDDERRRILETKPWLVANLDGIAFEDRVIAHQNWAQTRLTDPGISEEERRYLERVVSGTVQLLVYDPEQDRIIEVLGDLTVLAENVITYVPGTAASMEEFYGGAHQQVGRYLEQNLDGTVVFVYKDGPWAGWLPGERSNANPDSPFAQQRGDDLAYFQDLVEREPLLAGGHSIGISHSWGTTAMTNSEKSGAHYDTMISLSGAYTSGSWTPHDGTNYYYLQYDADMLANAEGATKGDSPQSFEVWDRVVFESDTILQIGDYRAGNAWENHLRIARGPEDNPMPLKYIKNLVNAEGGSGC